MDAKNMKTALTIAGSDSSGGAGIQADIKTMITNGVYAMSAITALTAQNTTGVSGIFDVTPEFLAAQLDAVFTDIFPDAVKIGMVSSPALIEVISERLRFYQAKHIVVDPVLVATSGSALASGGVPDLMKKLLFPLAEVITPNIPEGEVLSVMQDLAQEGMTMLVVTHEMAFARDVSSHVVYMNQGVICEEGAPAEVFGNPQRQETKDFLSRFRQS